MLISRSTCAPRLESSCSSNTLMKEDSGYRMESSDFCRLGSIKYLEFFPSFFFLFFFIFSSTFENSRTGPLYGNVPRAQAKGKALLSCCSKQFLARKNLAAPHFPLPAIPSLSSPLLRFFLSLSFEFSPSSMRFTILPSPLLMGRRQDFSTREKEKIVRIHHEIREEH